MGSVSLPSPPWRNCECTKSRLRGRRPSPPLTRSIREDCRKLVWQTFTKHTFNKQFVYNDLRLNAAQWGARSACVRSGCKLCPRHNTTLSRRVTDWQNHRLTSYTTTVMTNRYYSQLFGSGLGTGWNEICWLSNADNNIVGMVVVGGRVKWGALVCGAQQRFPSDPPPTFMAFGFRRIGWPSRLTRKNLETSFPERSDHRVTMNHVKTWLVQRRQVVPSCCLFSRKYESINWTPATNILELLSNKYWK